MYNHSLVGPLKAMSFLSSFKLLHWISPRGKVIPGSNAADAFNYDLLIRTKWSIIQFSAFKVILSSLVYVYLLLNHTSYTGSLLEESIHFWRYLLVATHRKSRLSFEKPPIQGNLHFLIMSTTSHKQTLQSDYPWTTSPLIVGAPMRLIAKSALVLAISRAGGIGFLGAGTEWAKDILLFLSCSMRLEPLRELWV